MKAKKYQKTILCLIIALSTTAMTYSQSNTQVAEKTNKALKQKIGNTASRSKGQPIPMADFGGFILHKVQLKSLTSLSPYAEEGAPDYNDHKEKLVGLVIFHRSKNKQDVTDAEIPDGVYVWNGEQWQSISLPEKNGTKSK
ncbi:hypothetical protein GGR21_004217 [Dysgonomonas hofstadii]|uniref:Uncharacterized protein n=1 Tax=Dysgonomonas hofstadii TaxID=637886 RepID=A0A840D031_9BACT|nr:hypothetical protein [Dysgonomonas hofstadii]MBB4038285.1 hypothetical protein [Dysgonomonas hofstadii]